MKALIYILAIALMAAGAVVALISFFSPGQVVLGLNLGMAASLIAGGAVTLGLAAVITALEDLGGRLARLTAAPARERGGGATGMGAVETGMPSSERMAAALGGEAAVAAATAGAAVMAAEEAQQTAESAPEQAAMERQIFLSPHPQAEELVKGAETVPPEAAEASEEAAEEEEESQAEAAEETAEEAAEQAAEEAEEAAPAAASEAVEEAGVEAGEEAGEEAVEAAGEEAAVEPGEEEVEVAGLYVVEERVIRGRPARMLSDGTVEAETDEGWMRFENLEHLEEYMEAMSHAR